MTFIKKAGAKIWRAKLVRPFSTAKGQHDLLENVLFDLELSSGIRGFGEAAVATHITGETVEETLKNLKEAARSVAGRELPEFPGIAEEFKGKFGKNKCALAALEMALLDAAARVKKVPLWHAFGTRLRTLRTDMNVMNGVGVNWLDLSVMTTAGVNWEGLDQLTNAGVNWDDLAVLIKLRAACRSPLRTRSTLVCISLMAFSRSD